MAYVLVPGPRMQREIRRVAADRLDDAIERLDTVISSGADAVDLETTVHEVRKRCKATRGLARLVRPALGDDFRRFDRTVRDAANQLSSLRDAHAVLATLDELLAARPDDDRLRTVRDRQAQRSLGVSRDAIEPGDDRLATARALLVEARAASQQWRIPPGFDTIEGGIVATYRQGRSGLRRLRADSTDERLHEWRKSVKYLWYQTQLVQDAAPSVLGPLVDQLDRLGEALGDDHDLTVLIELLDGFGDDELRADAAHVRKLARRIQRELRDRAVRSGATVYAERDDAFARRIARYWRLAVELGPERATGGLEVVSAPVEPRPPSIVERERRFLVDRIPDGLDLSGGVELRQGYLAADEGRSVRVRDAGPQGCTLTVKAGAGAERTELEWSIEPREFEAAWPHTEPARIAKRRYRIPAGDHVVELDVFGGALDGLVIAEVEFGSVWDLEAFEPLDWFGREVTDDGRYTNASLARHGLPSPV